MFGRQDPAANDTQQLDDEHAAYVADLTGAPAASVKTSSINEPVDYGFNASTQTPTPPPVLTVPDTSLQEQTYQEQPAQTDVQQPNDEPPLASDELLDIKHSVLTELSPLVGHLDQSPEERFKTTMMLIQASDDATLIKQAYEAARAIEDDKKRAQALLDIVNEINYFTQQQKH